MLNNLVSASSFKLGILCYFLYKVYDKKEWIAWICRNVVYKLVVRIHLPNITTFSLIFAAEKPYLKKDLAILESHSFKNLKPY